MKTKKKYSLNVGANYNSKKDEWDLSLRVNIDLEQENDTNGLLDAHEERYRLEEETD